MGKKKFTIQFTATEDGKLLREALAEVGISKRALTAIKFDGGHISVNGRTENVRFILRAGDVVEVIFPPEQMSEGIIPAYGMPFDIVYEDEAVIVLNKPTGISTIPSREHPVESVANYLAGYFIEQNLASTIHVVTRLDRDTAGLMCVAKHRHIHHLMGQMQINGKVHREYEAFVHGHVASDFVTIREPIGRKSDSIIEREVRADGQQAHTDCTVLKRFVLDGEKYSHVRLKLYTGRTHQIRVHMAHIGHPLMGDDLYGGLRTHLSHQALQCVHLSFVHPITKQLMNFSIPLMERMQNMLDC